ncbi:MAG: hypothetical protein COZ15_06095 [Elusimicrobia bacterium CG_4_10_14_3_um_filter_49_12_50_7]|nr:MAG: hypothetical protein COZ15_06095 [Elusimicrobia bacterium CG_4_10_14_3_um_filter_49_12_50_7]
MLKQLLKKQRAVPLYEKIVLFSCGNCIFWQQNKQFYMRQHVESPPRRRVTFKFAKTNVMKNKKGDVKKGTSLKKGDVLNITALLKRFPAVCALMLFGGSLSPLFSWGYDGHALINNGAIKNLPSEMKFFVKKRKVINKHVMDPDRRKGDDREEPVRHWLDLEYFGAPPFRALFEFKKPPREEDYKIRSGKLPWAIAETLEQLTEALTENDGEKIILLAADLAHYVGDGANPLHTTENYDGQWTGNRGIHSRFESALIKRYDSSVKIGTFSAVYVEDPLKFIFEYLIESHGRVEAILQADRKSCWEPGIYDNYYYDRMWGELEALINDCFSQGSFTLASLFYTAHINAAKNITPAGDSGTN